MRFCFKWVDGEYTSRKMRRKYVQIFHRQKENTPDYCSLGDRLTEREDFKMKLKKIKTIIDTDNHEIAKRKILIDAQNMAKEMATLVDMDTDTLIKNISAYPDIKTILIMETSSRHIQTDEKLLALYIELALRYINKCQLEKLKMDIFHID